MRFCLTSLVIIDTAIGARIPEKFAEVLPMPIRIPAYLRDKHNIICELLNYLAMYCL